MLPIALFVKNGGGYCLQAEKLAINESCDSGAKPLTRDPSRVCQPANSCAGLHQCQKLPSTLIDTVLGPLPPLEIFRWTRI